MEHRKNSNTLLTLVVDPFRRVVKYVTTDKVIEDYVRGNLPLFSFGSFDSQDFFIVKDYGKQLIISQGKYYMFPYVLGLPDKIRIDNLLKFCAEELINKIQCYQHYKKSHLFDPNLVSKHSKQISSVGTAQHSSSERRMLQKHRSVPTEQFIVSPRRN